MAKSSIVENPMINSPYKMPQRPFRFDKNDPLGFLIPYTHDGRGHSCIPDFISLWQDTLAGLVTKGEGMK
jgi:hypothetical protein